MPRQTKESIENNFTKGLVTYATGMNFPENAVTATNNFTYRPWGLVERRLGIDFEQGGFSNLFPAINKAISTFLWKDVAGDGNINFVVIQTGQFLQFFNIPLTTPPGVATYQTTIDLSAFQTQPVGFANWDQIECQFAAGNGFLFVVNPFITPVAIQYIPVSGQFIPIQIQIGIRDFDGAPEPGVPVNQRPSTLSNPHLYNLMNQGWTLPGFGDIFTGNTINTFFNATQSYPSNSDIWFTFKDSTNTFNPSATSQNVITGNTPAPTGHFVLDAFTQNRFNAAGLSLTTNVNSNFNQPTAVAFFAGRVWYSGVRYPAFNENIYFSTIISTVGAGTPTSTINNVAINEFGTCFQINDPTSQITFDLLPDDGGVIRIPDMGAVYKLFPIQNSLIVFASNGIWFISGSQGTGFEATSFSVNKLSAIRNLSNTSFVDVLGYPMWWTNEGIYALTVDTTANVSSGGLVIKSLTDFTIQQFFRNTIPANSKVFARGVYNPLKYTVHWLYNSLTQNPIGPGGAQVDINFTFDSVLTLNTLTGAWYVWTIPMDKVQIKGLYLHPTNIPGVDTYRIKYVSAVPQIDGINDSITFSEEINTNYLDWFSFDHVGESFTSSLTTGYKLHGNAAHRYQNRYVTLYFLNQATDAAAPVNPGTVVSSAYMQGVWDYALNNLADRVSAAELCRVTNNSFQSGIKKIKLRGRGRVFQMTITSESGFPCNLEGWALTEDINQAV